MKLVRLRQLRVPYRLLQQLTSLATGLIGKAVFDLANLPPGNPTKYWLPSGAFLFLLCICGTLVLIHFENRAELLR
jgi:hypothetical protein